MRTELAVAETERDYKRDYQGRTTVSVPVYLLPQELQEKQLKIDQLRWELRKLERAFRKELHELMLESPKWNGVGGE